MKHFRLPNNGNFTTFLLKTDLSVDLLRTLIENHDSLAAIKADCLEFRD